MRKIEGPQITIKLEQNQIDRIDRVAKRHGIKRNQAMRLLLETGLDAYEAYSMVGVPQLAELVKKTRKACERAIQPSLI